MTKKINVIVLLLVILGLAPSAASAEQTPVRTSSSYNTDSDGVSTTSYSISTEIKNKPWNFTYGNTKISQRDSSGVLYENRFITRWQQRLNEENRLSAWVGYSRSDNWKFASFGVQYEGVVNYIDYIRLGYSHDSVPTVAAYRERILNDRVALSYRQELDRRLYLETLLKYGTYSDGNFRKTFGLTLTKDFSPRYRLGLAYLYDTSDTDMRSVFYLPKGESSLSIVPEIAFPVGNGSLSFMMSRSIWARNQNGNIKRTTYGAKYNWHGLSLEMQYYRDDNYWSRDYSFSWNKKW